MSTYYLSPAGNDSAAGTQAAPWRTLSKAAAAVSGGDEVVLRAGTYSGGVTFNDPNLLIRSYAGERAAISSPTTNSSIQQTIDFGTNSSGSTLRGLDVSGGYYYAVKLEDNWSAGRASAAARNITIEDCLLHDSGRDVVKITPGCDDVTIRRCEIYNSGKRDASNAEGIDDVNGDRLTVQDCFIHDIATNGLYAKGGASGCVIERNRIERTGSTGISLGYVDTDAPWFDADNTSFYESIDSTVRNNLVSDTPWAGVAVYGALRPSVYNNTLVNVAKTSQGGIMLARGEINVNGTMKYPATRDATFSNNIVSTPSRASVLIRTGGLAGTLTMQTNRYFRSGTGSATFSDERTGFSGGLAGWKSDVGTDGTSTEGNPLLDGTSHLTASSPLVNAGTDLSSTGFSDDFDKQARPAGAAWDVGADEYNGSVTPPPSDTTAPAVSGTGSSNVSQAGATVSWTTDEPATSQVQYGTTTAYGTSTALDPALVTSHAVALTGLAAGTTYHYRVLSRDAAGNLATSGDYVLTTLTAPPPTSTTQFSPIAYSGDFANYAPVTASRWQVTTESSGEKRLTINTSAYDAPAEDLVGEYALLKGQAYGDFDLSLRAKSNESLSSNPSADYVVVFGYQDANNYAYLMMSGRASNTRLFRVSNGVPTALPAAASAGIRDTNWHDAKVSRRGSTVTVSLDGTQLLSTTSSLLGVAGAVGVGSYNDAASFDDIAVTAPPATMTAAAAPTAALWPGSITKEVLV